MKVTVGMLKDYLKDMDDNLEVVVYDEVNECDTFLYGAPVVCGVDEFNYCGGDSVAYDEEEGKQYCYFGKSAW